MFLSDEEATAAKKLGETQCVDTLKEAGSVCRFDKVYDRITTRNSIPIRRCQGVQFINVTASQDPVLTGLAQAKAGNVYSTDTGMLCHRHHSITIT